MIVSVPLARPVLVGVNVTLMSQWAPAVAREHVPGEAANGAAAATAMLCKLIILPSTPPAEFADAMTVGFKPRLVPVSFFAEIGTGG